MLKEIPTPLQQKIISMLEMHYGNSVTLLSFKSVGGGCINEVGRITTNRGNVFLKWNLKDRYPDMFAAEAQGLRLLAGAKALKIPDVIGVSAVGNNQFLLLENIHSSSRHKSFDEQLGKGLADLHRISSIHFGLDHDNYVGSLAQKNSVSHDWISFFIESRLAPQLALAEQKRLLPLQVSRDFEKLYSKLPSLLPEEKPSLLHGDLWSGNVIVEEDGGPCLIDPAVYFGHREVDLAMTTLFGGFAPDFYHHYHEHFPLEQGWRERLPLYNLYPLLVHVNLFGQAYLGQVKSILENFFS